MRLQHPDGTDVHLAYCTNVHPAEDLPGITAQLDDYALPVRERLGADTLGLGLWLSHSTADVLDSDPAALARLRAELRARGLETVTFNGFPYRGFHDPVVKHAVYAPDWSDPRRLAHTLRLARVLAALLPEDAARGSISTLPFGWRTPWPADRHEAALRQLDLLAAGLRRIEADTGRTIKVAVEPEPGCVTETVRQTAAALAGTDHERIGLCLDACHLAVAHESADDAVSELAAHGVPLVKLQASAALCADRPRDPEVRAALRTFVEPRFLHQTRERAGGSAPGGREPVLAPQARDDLDEALAEETGLPGRAPWRVHYHVPLHTEPAPPLSSTRPELRATLRTLFAGGRALTDHVEVETYTWTVLPKERRPAGRDGLVAGIAAELDWTRAELTALGLRGPAGSQVPAAQGPHHPPREERRR
ncbi:metabolite traffic protein EboE [Streptomyces sp. NPDC087849]|uniref:metabolite traffic protein EboE n=1 Tax=Streptomyces sp. NPDC087849 TaxID=3365808 RepID=UPI0037F61E6D